eukprot:5777265-Amphidinium_carterae.1
MGGALLRSFLARFGANGAPEYLDVPTISITFHCLGRKKAPMNINYSTNRCKKQKMVESVKMLCFPEFLSFVACNGFLLDYFMLVFCHVLLHVVNCDFLPSQLAGATLEAASSVLEMLALKIKYRCEPPGQLEPPKSPKNEI